MNKQNTNSNQKGFTIIEVVLVLAIAGLIFLVVFLALPALQRSQRDTQRKNDLGRLMSQVTTYQSNNQGQLPSNWSTFTTNYLTSNNQTFADPSTGNTYSVAEESNQNNKPAIGEIKVYINARCDATQGDGLNTGSGSRSFATIVYQEQGGYSCQNN